MYTRTFTRTPFTVFAADTGGGTGGTGEGQAPDAGEGQDPAGNDGNGQDPPQGEPPQDGKDAKEPAEIGGIKKADVDAAVWTALLAAHQAAQIAEANKERANREAAKLRVQAKKDEEARLAKDKQFEELAAKRGQELEALTPKLEAAEKRLEAYEKAEAGRLAERIKAWPKEIRDLIEGQADIQAKAAMVDKLAATVEKANNQPAPKGAGRDPKGSGPQGKEVTPPFNVKARI